MTLPVSHYTWVLLRMLARGGNTPMTGRQLRHSPSRQTKDGTFLTRLVEAGLIEVVSVDDPPPVRPGAWGGTRSPVQFHTRYRLTEKGIRAAEYGEYDRTRQPGTTKHKSYAI